MNITILGYGKMGHAVERIARQRGHNIVSIIDLDTPGGLEGANLAETDVVIEFTTPATAVENYKKLLTRGLPIVSGTTGWHDRYDEVSRLVDETGGKMLWTSNFSLGVNIFFHLNRYLARIISPLPSYHPSIHEIHHIHKLDHPSGTAVSLAQDIVEIDPAIQRWEETPGEGVLEVTNERIGETPGFHEVSWDSDVDRISISHTSKSRDGLALGAVLAAEWLAKAPSGMHSMDELMKSLLPSL